MGGGGRGGMVGLWEWWGDVEICAGDGALMVDGVRYLWILCDTQHAVFEAYVSPLEMQCGSRRGQQSKSAG